MIFGQLGISLGATPPSALLVYARLNGASQFDSFNVDTNFLVGNANLFIPVLLYGPRSVSSYMGIGTQIQIGVNPTGQAVTCLQNITRAYVMLGRAEDTIP
jgi:hypothetical protein